MELVDLATEAFKRANFELASDLFDRLLDKDGQDIDILLMKGDSLANMGRMNEALNAYSRAFRKGEISTDKLHGFVNALVKNLRQRPGTRLTRKLSIFSCSACCGLLSKPTTLLCGHTFCKNCLDHQSKRICNICCFPYSGSGDRCKKLNVNVIVSELLQKYFPQEVHAQDIKAEGNELFKMGRHLKAVEKYSLAIRTAPGDHLCLSNRAHAYCIQGRYVEALQDANKVCQMRPDWAKGFYRRGCALVGLERHQEAMVSLLQCLAIDPTIHSAMVSLTKVIHTLLQPVDTGSVRAGELEQCLPDPSLALPDLSGVIKVLADGGVVDLNGRRCDGEEPREGGGCGGEGDEDGEGAGSNGDSTEEVQSCVMPSKMLDRGKFCHDKQMYPKKRQPSESDEVPPSPPGSLTMAEDHNQSKRFKKRPLNPQRESAPEKEPAVSSCPAYEVPLHLIEKVDFECSLCLRLFNQPTTTLCGHTFCRGCLDRCRDYSQTCPLCKQSLTDYHAERRENVTILLQELMETYLPSDVRERQLIHRKELEQVASHALTDGGEIPIFVCTIALPTIPCPLHIFEPRYRLMVRQVMESGARQFGMCVADAEHKFSEFGCMLEINQLEYLPDGRCILGTVGGRRFRVLERGMRDGYNTAKVEFIKDTIVEGGAVTELRQLDDAVYQQARTWFVNLPIYHQTRIVEHFGPMPRQASDPQASFNGPQWHWWLLAILPLHHRIQLSVMSRVALKERLQALQLGLTRMTTLPS